MRCASRFACPDQAHSQILRPLHHHNSDSARTRRWRGRADDADLPVAARALACAYTCICAFTCICASNERDDETTTTTSTYACYAQQASCANAPPPASPVGAASSLFTTTDPFYLTQAQAAQALSANAGRNFSSFSGGAFNGGGAFNVSSVQFFLTVLHNNLN